MSEPSYYYTGAPSVAGIPIPSDGCIIDGSHDSDEGLSARILDEAHAYGMPVRLGDSIYWHERIADRIDERASNLREEAGPWAPDSELHKRADYLRQRALDHRWAHSEASEGAVDWLNTHALGASFYVDESCLFVEFVDYPAMDELAHEYWVCTDCYFAHHQGAHEHEGAWYAGDSDTPADREPLGEIPQGWDVTDWTDSETGEGKRSFDWGACDGCGSALGGARYRLAVWHPDTSAYNEYWRACVAEACEAFTVASWRVHGRPHDALGTGAQR